MSKEICISSTPHETRLAIIENDELAEIYYERENEYTLAGSIYKGRVTRVLPGMQSAFVDVGLERDAFLYVTDFLEEQEDSADFERVGGAPRREGARENNRETEGGQQREGRNREPRENREQRDRPRAAAQPDQLAQEAAVITPSPTEGRENESDQGGTRRWRGRRGRRRGVRGPQQGRSGETQITHEETADPEESFAVEASSVPEPFVAVEPRPTAFLPAPPPQSQQIFLPGESLSKYGHARAVEPEIEIESLPSNPIEPFKATPAYTSFKPSTLIETPIEWDGGSLLPGETISRYRNDPPQAAAAAPELPTEEVHEIQAVDAHITTPEEEQFEAAEEAEAEAAAEETSAIVGHAAEPTIEAEPVAEIHHPEHQHTSEESVEPIHEDAEPESASASYRVDPTAPSEFRLPTQVEELPEEIAAESVEAPAAYQEPIAAFQEHVDRPHVDRVLGSFAPVVESYEPQPVVEEASPVEATTAIDASAGAAPAEVVPTEEEEAAAEREQLLNKEQTLEELQDVAEDFEESDEESDEESGDGTAQGFAPGNGVIEEETIEEEEYEYTPLYAHHDEHDLDELEEHTIDHNLTGTDLGEAVRDAHLDKRINVAFNSDVATEDADVDEDLDESEEESGVEAIGDDGFDEESEEGTPEGAPAPSRRPDDGRRGGRGGRHGRRRGSNGGSGGGDRGRRATAQMSDLPIISDLLKQGQEILVQIAKEPIAKKGARITSHIALPGRFLVFMPTVNHVGVSRKISSDEERQRLKRILISEKGENTGGFIVRTAADGASEDDLRADIRFLISLWAEIKQRSDSGKAPALIYHDLNLVERILRDQVSDNFSSIWVDNEVEYERIVRFLNRFQPSLVRRVKLYTKETPLFEQFGIQDEITKALKSKVWLKSGGSIVINQTEALVAIDINTGKYVGKTARLEDTILKTNLDAIPEIVRQIRLRDLGGIIVIDFIDMDERKNRHRVMQALEEALKADRAPSKVLQFNDFGLVAITRKRVKQSLERTLSVQCNICQGTGMVKSPATVCNEIYVEMRKMQKSFDRGDVLLRVHPDVVKTLKEHNARWLTELEEMISKNIIVKSDPSLHPEQFDIH